MKIINFAVKRPVTMTIIIAVVFIMGVFTYSKMALDLYPDMKLPYAAVITTYSGAGPEEVESQITKPLESTLNSLANVKEIQSTSSSGSSMVLLSYNWGTNMESAIADIREKTGMVEKALPDGADKPLVVKMDVNQMPIIQIAINGGDKVSLAKLQSIAENDIVPRLSRIPEVASVTVTGGLEREVKVDVDPAKLENYGLTLASVNQILQAENFNMSSGKAEQGGREYYVRSLQQFENIDDIRNVAITSAAGNTIYLRDIAGISDGYKDNPQITRVNGSTSVGIHCLKQSGANTVQACDNIKKELDSIIKDLNVKLSVNIVMDQSEFIKQSINSVTRTMLEGALLAALVLYIFLRNVRSTVIICTAIPLSIICTFILMYFNHNTLNLITMGGLALGIGRMIDDSIVVFENIFRHRSQGLGPVEAALAGASEVGSAVIASTTTLIAVFFPILFTEGLAGVLFKPLAITVSFAIFCSLMVALTIVPLLSSRMLTDKAMLVRQTHKGRIRTWVAGIGERIDNLGEKYQEIIRWALGHRRIVILSITALMAISIALTPFIGAEFIPKMDSGQISVSIEADKGSKINNTNEIVTQVENKLHDIPEVDTIFSSIGSSGNMMFDTGTQSDQGAVTVKLKAKNERRRSVDSVAEEVREKVAPIAGAKINVTVSDAMSGGSSSGAPVNVQVRGDDLQVLRDIAGQVSAVVKQVPGTREVTSSLSDGNPEIQLKIDRKKAAQYGLTPVQVATQVKNALQGTVTTRYRVEGQEIDVRVRYAPQDHESLSYLQNMTVLNASGAVLKLSQLAAFEMEPGPIQITRIDKVRRAEINANLLNRDLKAVMTDVQSGVAKIKMPPGYTIVYGGENKDMMESFSSLALALLLAIVLVYAVMAIQYESFFNPFIIMFSVPTALIGVVLSLLLTGKSFSVPAFIGIIMLVGIVVSNAIVLVDYLKRLIDKGMARNEAIIEAGRVRLRPILMTAFATILAMLPMAMGIGEGSESDAPLAIVIIGGLLVSTFITLVLVPVVYSLFDDWSGKIKMKLTKNSAISTEESVTNL